MQRKQPHHVHCSTAKSAQEPIAPSLTTMPTPLELRLRNGRNQANVRIVAASCSDEQANDRAAENRRDEQTASIDGRVHIAKRLPRLYTTTGPRSSPRLLRRPRYNGVKSPPNAVETPKIQRMMHASSARWLGPPRAVARPALRPEREQAEMNSWAIQDSSRRRKFPSCLHIRTTVL